MTDDPYFLADHTLTTADKSMKGNNASWEAQATLGAGYAILAVADALGEISRELKALREKG